MTMFQLQRLYSDKKDSKVIFNGEYIGFGRKSCHYQGTIMLIVQPIFKPDTSQILV
jgi:hypothetical protein